MRPALVLSWILVTACGDDGGNRPADAAPDTNACSATTDTCSAEMICVMDTCMPAFPRAYVMKDVAIMLPPMNNGTPWDPADNPDPYIAIAVDGTVIVSSTPAPNTFMQTFPGPFDITLGTNLTVTIYDEDGPTDDTAFICAAMPVMAAQLRSRMMNCTASTGSVAFKIEPK